MAYKQPSLIDNIIKTMDHPDFLFFIHVDKKIPIQEFNFLLENNFSQC